MLCLDLKDPYLHVLVHQLCHKYLHFAIMKYHFQFTCLFFDLSTFPRTFSKVLLHIIAILRKKGLQMSHYLDDVLLVAPEPQVLTEHWEILVRTLLKSGWIINWQKSTGTIANNAIFGGDPGHMQDHSGIATRTGSNTDLLTKEDINMVTSLGLPLP